jgi:hypothetical protein
LVADLTEAEAAELDEKVWVCFGTHVRALLFAFLWFLPLQLLLSHAYACRFEITFA